MKFMKFFGWEDDRLGLDSYVTLRYFFTYNELKEVDHRAVGSFLLIHDQLYNTICRETHNTALHTTYAWGDLLSEMTDET